MKKIFSFCITLIVFSIITVPALAEDVNTASPIDTTNTTTGTTNTTNNNKNLKRPFFDNSRTASSSTNKAQRTETITTNLNQRAENEINRRIDSLKNLLTQISQFEKLSSSEKSTLTTEVQGQIDALTALLAKIKADTDTATLKADVKSIVDSYRIFALFRPQIEILGSADKILTTDDQMNSYSATLQTKITDAKNKGKDTTDLETLLSDMNKKITDAKIQIQGQPAMSPTPAIQGVIDLVSSLTPAGFPGNKSTLENARTMIKTAHQDLLTARQDARQIIMGLMKLGSMSKLSGTSFPRLTCTPRPKCLDANPACKILVTPDMCPKPSDTPTSDQSTSSNTSTTQ